MRCSVERTRGEGPRIVYDIKVKLTLTIAGGSRQWLYHRNQQAQEQNHFIKVARFDYPSKSQALKNRFPIYINPNKESRKQGRMIEQTELDEQQPQADGVSLTLQKQTREDRKWVSELPSRSIQEPSNSHMLKCMLKSVMSSSSVQKQLAQQQKMLINESSKKLDEVSRRIAEQKKKKEQGEARKIASAFETNGGTVGQGNKTRCGIWALSHFITVDYPQLNQNSTVIVTIGSKEYTSKPYKQWLIGSVTMIPLQHAPISNVQIDILDISKLNCPSIQSFYMFGKVEGKTQMVRLCMDDGKIKYKIDVNHQDLFNCITKGAPVMAIHNGNPAIFCLKEYNQDNAAQKFKYWTFKPNLDKENMQKMIQLKLQISKRKEQIDQLQTELDKLTSFRSYISSNIFSSNVPQIYISPQAFYPFVILQQTSKEDRTQFRQIQNFQVNCQSKQMALADKGSQFCRSNRIQNVPKMNNQERKSIQEENYIAKYNINNAHRKFTLLDGVNQQGKWNFLDYFVRRAYYNMKYVASWPQKRHILVASSIRKEKKDGKFEFSYETVMCKCGCKENGRHQHDQNMKKIALSKPLKFIIAILDAIIQLEEHYIIHNDIQFRNFIYYGDDFLLGDFDLSCFVKDENEIRLNECIELELNRLNLNLIDRNKFITKHLEQNQQQINIFFMHTEGQLDKNQRSDETLNRLQQTMSKSHQKQLKGLLEELFSGQCNISDDNMKEINQMLLTFKNTQINAVKVYKEIMKWAQENRETSSLENI